MNDIRWLKFNVHTTDSIAFKTMRLVRRNHRNMRDTLGMVWFELFDLAGQLEMEGRFIAGGVILDCRHFAVAFTRREETVRFCVDWYLENGMLTHDPETGALMIPGWESEQSTGKLLNAIAKTKEHKKQAEEDAASDAEKISDAATEEKTKEEKNKKEKKREEKKREDACAPADADDGDAGTEAELTDEEREVILGGYDVNEPEASARWHTVHQRVWAEEAERKERRKPDRMPMTAAIAQ